MARTWLFIRRSVKLILNTGHLSSLVESVRRDEARRCAWYLLRTTVGGRRGFFQRQGAYRSASTACTAENSCRRMPAAEASIPTVLMSVVFWSPSAFTTLFSVH